MIVTRWDIVSTRPPGQDGKKRYHKIGVMFPNRDGNGFSIKLDSLPLTNEKGELWLSAYEPRPKDSAPKSQGGQIIDLNDEVPF
jgi:hypothetical protein